MIKSAVAFAVVLGSAGAARADECKGNDLKVTQAAEQLLRGATIVQYCETCANDEMGEPIKVASVERAQFTAKGEPYYVLTANYVWTLDLAFTYVLQGDRYVNVGMLAGCGARGMSATLSIEHLDGNRVMITPAHDELAAPLPEPEPTPAPAPVVTVAPPAPIAVAEPVPLVVHTEDPSSLMWLGAGLGALGCGGAIGLTLTLAARARRRRGMRPRAADLLGGPR